jgi:uncharacterized protein (DUF302 family)
MPVTQINVQRVSVISAKPFEDVIQAVHDAIGHPNLAAMQREVAAAKTYPEMEFIINEVTGPTGLMEFMRLDMGMYLAKGRPGKSPRSHRLLVGNPLIMRRMAEHVPDAASYAPVTILIDEREDGVHLSYDRMASFLASYANAEASAVAVDLDRKVEAMLTEAAG